MKQTVASNCVLYITTVYYPTNIQYCGSYIHVCVLRALLILVQWIVHTRVRVANSPKCIIRNPWVALVPILIFEWSTKIGLC